MRKLFRNKFEAGASALTYAILVGLIGVVAISAIGTAGSQVNRLFGTVAGSVAGRVPVAPRIVPGLGGYIGASCQAGLASFPELQGRSGAYRIGPSPAAAYDVTCDMVTLGGGWTLCASVVQDSTNGLSTSYLTGGYNPTNTLLSLTSHGSLCHRIRFSNVYAEAYAGSSAGTLTIRTGAVAMTEAAFVADTLTRATAGSDTVAFDTRSTLQLAAIGGNKALAGTGCGFTGNNRHQGQIICVGTTGNSSTGGVGRYLLSYGALNAQSPTGPYDYGNGILMCDYDQWCGNGNLSNRFLIYAR